MKFKLTAPHYAYDTYLLADTVVGDGTSWPWKNADGTYIRPSFDMEPLDDDAKAAISVLSGVNPAELVDTIAPVFDTTPPKK